MPTLSGSLNITGSLIVNTITASFISGSITNAITASYALNATTASYAVSSPSASYAANATSASNALTASYVNPLNQDVSITGSLIVSQNLTVIGTSSFTYTTSSIVQVGSNTIQLNTNNPSARFGGLTVIDSGSFGTSSTGSLFWDSSNNKWIYSNPSGSSYDGGMLISGPRNTSGLGNETGMVENFVAVGQGTDHIQAGTIYNSGSTTQITGSLLINSSGTGYDLSVGSDKLFVSASGNVGIGTTTPLDKLSVAGDISMRFGQDVLRARGFAYSKLLETGYDGVVNQDYLKIYTAGEGANNANPKITIQRDGNVGIGTTNPIWKFAVSKAGDIGLEIDPDSGTPGKVGMYAYNRSTTTHVPLQFEASQYIFYTGNVGIGTTTPSAKLDMNGSINIASGLGNTSTRPAILAGSSISGEIRAYSTDFGNVGDDGFVRISAGAGTNSSTKSYIDITGFSTIPDMNKNIVLGTSGVERMRIDANGNVGIGTTTPNAKLDVNGNTIITGSLNNGSLNISSGLYSHAEGLNTISSGNYSHAEGNNTTSSNLYSHAEGQNTLSSGVSSHAEGYNTTASGGGSHSEGQNTISIGEGSHAEGAYTTSSGVFSHSEGNRTISSGSYSHAEGYNTTASGTSSHTEGHNTIARGVASHAEGYNATSSGDWSHAEGNNTVSSGSYQHVQGQFNISSSIESAFIVGNGTSASTRSNLIFAAGTTVQITGSLAATTVNINSVTTGTTTKNLGIDSTGKVIQVGNCVQEVFMYNFLSNTDNLDFYNDGLVKFGWDAPGDDLEFYMLTEPAGASDIRCLSTLNYGTQQNTSVTTPNILYDIYGAGVPAGNQLNAIITAETDSTYPMYQVDLYNASSRVTVKITKTKII